MSDFGDDPPPMAEQLRYLVLENRELKARLAKAEGRAREWGDGLHEFRAAFLDAEAELAAVRAAVLHTPEGSSDAEVLAAVRHLLRNNTPDPVAEVESQMPVVKSMQQAMREQGFA